jgi:hypothetical protein
MNERSSTELAIGSGSIDGRAAAAMVYRRMGYREVTRYPYYVELTPAP